MNIRLIHLHYRPDRLAQVLVLEVTRGFWRKRTEQVIVYGWGKSWYDSLGRQVSKKIARFCRGQIFYQQYGVDRYGNNQSHDVSDIQRQLVRN